jgi:PAS domain S-box-containing protein
MNESYNLHNQEKLDPFQDPGMLVQQLPAAVYTTDKDGKINFCNEAAEALWGRVPDFGNDRYTGAWKMYTANETLIPANALSPVGVALGAGTPQNGIEYIIERPDGSRRLVIQQSRAIFDEQRLAVGTLNSLMDITELKQMGESLASQKMLNSHTKELIRKNEELKRSEERYHKMIEEVEDYAILLLDKDGIIQNWNKGAEKIKGYREDEIIGQSFRIFYLPEDRDKKLPEELINRAAREGKAVHEGWRVRKDSTRFWGSIVITALHDEHGAIIGFSKVTRDLTEIKAASDKINNYARELEFQNRELQQFAYAAAHDLKEPLRKVQFYNSVILEKVSGTLPEKEKTYLNNSVNSVIRMRGLIDDLLRYSEMVRMDEAFKSVGLRAIVEEVKAFYLETLGAGNIDLDISESVKIWVIPFQIRQLFENLIGNAIKYQQKDNPVQITITCSREDRLARESGPDGLQPYYKITVRDNGIGFQPAYAAKIFDLFHRLHGRTEYPGTGVGLAICKKIVQNHQGSIEADGITGEGSVFTVHLPATIRH